MALQWRSVPAPLEHEQTMNPATWKANDLESLIATVLFHRLFRE